MNAPRPSIKYFASAVVAAELADADGDGPDELAAMTLRVVAKLQSTLGKLVGSTGFEVLLARALVLAKRTTPLLSHVAVGPGGNLIGLVANDRASAEQQTVSLLSHLIDLVAVLIGEDLAIRLLRNVWPEVPEGGAHGSDDTTR